MAMKVASQCGPQSCRICLATAEEAAEEDDDGPLVSPCGCRGTGSHVHVGCLFRHYWARGVWDDLACPTCELPYEPDVAIELGSHGLGESEREYGPDSLENANVLVALGEAYGRAGDPEPQRELIERALAAYVRAHGGDRHPDVARALLSLGFALGALGDAEMQTVLAERALALNEEFFGPDSTEVADTLIGLGNAFARVSAHAQQREVLQRALSIYEGAGNAYGAALAQTGLGNAYGALGDTSRKLDLLSSARDLMVHIYGPEHPEVATVLANLGMATWSLGRQPQAISLLWRARGIFRREYGEADRDLQLALSALDDLRDPGKAALGALLLGAVLRCHGPASGASGAAAGAAARAGGVASLAPGTHSSGGPRAVEPCRVAALELAFAPSTAAAPRGLRGAGGAAPAPAAAARLQRDARDVRELAAVQLLRYALAPAPPSAAPAARPGPAARGGGRKGELGLVLLQAALAPRPGERVAAAHAAAPAY